MVNEAYYKCPHCKGKVMIVLRENGLLVLLRHIEEAKDNE